MNETLDGVWDRAVGGLDWLKHVALGEFDENRPLSAVIADMTVGFVPGVVIVVSARDLTAIIVRLAKHPERRELTEEWMLLIACSVPLVLPVLAAAAGATAGGVGAIVGGIAGSEAGGLLRGLALALIRDSAPLLADVVGFLRRFVKGDILKLLRDIKFTQYQQALVRYVTDFIDQLIKIIGRVREELLKLEGFKQVAEVLRRLQALERAFYSVQAGAIAALPRALAELDVRLQRALEQSLSPRPRFAEAGIGAPAMSQHAQAAVLEPERVRGKLGNMLGRLTGGSGGVTPPKLPKTPPRPNLHPEDAHLARHIEPIPADGSRELTIDDLGIKGDVSLLMGHIEMRDGVAIATVDWLGGEIKNPLEIIKNLSEVAKASGATSLRVQGVIINEPLAKVLEKRYGLVYGSSVNEPRTSTIAMPSSYGEGSYYDYFTVPLD